ncbi:MAG: hypothetical protein ABSE20_05775 [Acetobacteraceae bacterium]
MEALDRVVDTSRSFPENFPSDPARSDQSGASGPIETYAEPSWIWPVLWVGLGVFVLAVSAIIGLSIDSMWFSPLKQFRDTFQDAMVLGASIVLAAVAISSFALLIARVSATTAMMKELTDVRRHIGRAEGHLATIRKHGSSAAAGV